MSEHTAIVKWRLAHGSFCAGKYSRRHTWKFDGGAEVHASSSPHVVPEPFSDPTAIDPEEAFVAAIASCHMLWFLSIASKKGFTVKSYSDEAVGVMAKNNTGRLAIIQITLRPRVAFSAPTRPSEESFIAMHDEAHEQCFLANSVKSEIRCKPLLVEE